MAKFQLKGKREMLANLRRMASGAPEAAKSALRAEAERIMTTSKKEFVPVDLGPLRSSGHVQEPVRSGKEVSVTLAFGGAAAPYALAVHEHPSPHSPPSWQGAQVTFSPPGRGPKYLERPLMDAMKGMDERLGERMKRLLGGEGDGGKVPRAPRERDERGRFK